jgi:plastocyanin
MSQFIARSHVRCAPAWLITGLLVVPVGCGHEAARTGQAENRARAENDREVVNEAVAGGSQEAQPGLADQAKVSIGNFTFSPETIEIPAGTKVIWVNGDDVPHTVRSTDDVFRSEALDTDDQFEHLFSQPGTYEYFCGVHTHMTGKVVVK